eukprot:TRINITY_DN88021_c0_g1_i1.p1 TRINITY_DN88021_c0_g1~~TRINITY_DN88021_c0_g1_i1.p1  ORF type:complete len:773 (+),score=111.39 TRINITY_DN88021_c0_g1_i1:78-2396(+)
MPGNVDSSTPVQPFKDGGIATRGSGPNLQLTSSWVTLGGRKRSGWSNMRASFKAAWNTEALNGSKRPLESRQTTLAINSTFVMKEGNKFRRLWNGMIGLLLLYTGTLFPYKLCFLDFRIHGSDSVENDQEWIVTEMIVDILFWFDLIVIFFFSYKDDRQHEVCDLYLIAKRYICGFFFVNLLACIPPLWFSAIVGGDGAGGVNRSLRLTRMSRVSRLARLGRLAKLAPFLRESPLWQQIQAFRGVRMFNLTVGLFWVVHMIACLWYLCASLHENPRETWVGRRPVNYPPEGTDIKYLISAGPLTQWQHAIYFVLTVFTTVGFGDVSALTTFEMAFVNITMIVGTVVNSVIMSEVINTLTTVDKASYELAARASLIKEFCEHAQLPAATQSKIERVVKKISPVSHMTKAKASDMKIFFSSNNLPPSIMQMVLRELFHGRLVDSEFLTLPSEDISMPPRLPLVLASVIQQKIFEEDEVVYQNGDQSMHIYLVLRGTFAYMGVPGNESGQSFVPPKLVKSAFAGRFRNSPGWKVDEEDSDEESVVAVDDEDFEKQRLFPYMLLGNRKYFGEFELMHRDVPPRQAYVQCVCEEHDGAAVLLLQKSEFNELKSEYPNYGHAWLVAGRRKEGHRVRALADCTTDRWLGRVAGIQGKRQSSNCRYLAITTIQRFWKEHFKNTHPKPQDLHGSASLVAVPATEIEQDLPNSPPSVLWASSPPSAQPPKMAVQTSSRSPQQEDAGDVRQLCSAVAQIDARVNKLQDTVDKLVQELRANRLG